MPSSIAHPPSGALPAAGASPRPSSGPVAGGDAARQGAAIVDRHTAGLHTDLPAVAHEVHQAVQAAPQHAGALVQSALQQARADDRGTLATLLDQAEQGLSRAGEFIDHFTEQAPGLFHDLAELPAFQSASSPDFGLLKSAQGIEQLVRTEHPAYNDALYVGTTQPAGNLWVAADALSNRLPGPWGRALGVARNVLTPFVALGSTFQASVSYKPNDAQQPIGAWAGISPTGNVPWGGSTLWAGYSHPLAKVNGGVDGPVVRGLADFRLTPGTVGINAGLTYAYSPFTGGASVSAYGPELNISRRWEPGSGLAPLSATSPAAGGTLRVPFGEKPLDAYTRDWKPSTAADTETRFPIGGAPLYYGISWNYRGK